MSDVNTCAVGPCKETRVAGSPYCRKHGPQSWTGGASASSTAPAVQSSVPTSPPANRPPWGKITAWSLVIALVVGLWFIGKAQESHHDSGSDAASFVSDVSQNAEATASGVTALLAELRRVSNGGGIGLVVQVASDSNELHGHLDDFRQDLYTKVDFTDDTQNELFDAENTLKKGVGAVHAWTDNPSPANTASWGDQLADGIAHWNDAVTKLWRDAKAGAPPTISVS